MTFNFDTFHNSGVDEIHDLPVLQATDPEDRTHIQHLMSALTNSTQLQQGGYFTEITVDSPKAFVTGYQRDNYGNEYTSMVGLDSVRTAMTSNGPRRIRGQVVMNHYTSMELLPSDVAIPDLHTVSRPRSSPPVDQQVREITEILSPRSSANLLTQNTQRPNDSGPEDKVDDEPLLQVNTTRTQRADTPFPLVPPGLQISSLNHNLNPPIPPVDDNENYSSHHACPTNHDPSHCRARQFIPLVRISSNGSVDSTFRIDEDRRGRQGWTSYADASHGSNTPSLDTSSSTSDDELVLYPIDKPAQSTLGTHPLITTNIVHYPTSINSPHIPTYVYPLSKPLHNSPIDSLLSLPSPKLQYSALPGILTGSSTDTTGSSSSSTPDSMPELMTIPSDTTGSSVISGPDAMVKLQDIPKLDLDATQPSEPLSGDEASDRGVWAVWSEMSRHLTQDELDAYGTRRKEDIVTELPEMELERLVAIIEAREEARTTGALKQAYVNLGAELTKYSLMFKFETAATRQREVVSQQRARTIRPLHNPPFMPRPAQEYSGYSVREDMQMRCGIDIMWMEKLSRLRGAELRGMAEKDPIEGLAELSKAEVDDLISTMDREEDQRLSKLTIQLLCRGTVRTFKCTELEDASPLFPAKPPPSPSSALMTLATVAAGQSDIQPYPRPPRLTSDQREKLHASELQLTPDESAASQRFDSDSASADHRKFFRHTDDPYWKQNSTLARSSATVEVYSAAPDEPFQFNKAGTTLPTPIRTTQPSPASVRDEDSAPVSHRTRAGVKAKKAAHRSPQPVRGRTMTRTSSSFNRARVQRSRRRAADRASSSASYRAMNSTESSDSSHEAVQMTRLASSHPTEAELTPVASGSNNHATQPNTPEDESAAPGTWDEYYQQFLVNIEADQDDFSAQVARLHDAPTNDLQIRYTQTTTQSYDKPSIYESAEVNKLARSKQRVPLSVRQPIYTPLQYRETRQGQEDSDTDNSLSTQSSREFLVASTTAPVDHINTTATTSPLFLSSRGPITVLNPTPPHPPVLMRDRIYEPEYYIYSDNRIAQRGPTMPINSRTLKPITSFEYPPVPDAFISNVTILGGEYARYIYPGVISDTAAGSYPIPHSSARTWNDRIMEMFHGRASIKGLVHRVEGYLQPSQAIEMKRADITMFIPDTDSQLQETTVPRDPFFRSIKSVSNAFASPADIRLLIGTHLLLMRLQQFAFADLIDTALRTPQNDHFFCHNLCEMGVLEEFTPTNHQRALTFVQSWQDSSYRVSSRHDQERSRTMEKGYLDEGEDMELDSDYELEQID